MNDERQAFEALMARLGYHLEPATYRDGTYRDTEYSAGWAVWQAARAASPVQQPVAWREHVEQRLLTWRQRTMNRSGDHLALDDFMDKESLADLIDFVCDECAQPPTPQPPQGAQQEPLTRWQPIETAPKGIEQVLLRVPTRFAKWGSALACQGYWMSAYWVIFNADEAVQRVEPTHWMPLPAPPSQEGETR
jgi:hypothetical protein